MARGAGGGARPRGVEVACAGASPAGPWSVRVAFSGVAGAGAGAGGGGGTGGGDGGGGALLWVDAGAAPAPVPVPLGSGAGSARVDVVLLTSARPERVCALPIVVASLGAGAAVLASAPTKSLLREVLPRSRGLLPGAPPGAVWGEEEVRRALQRVTPLAPHAETALLEGRLRVRAFPSGGPTLGATLFWVGEAGGASVVVAGEWGGLETRGLPRASLPRLRPDVLVTEAPAVGDAGLGGAGGRDSGGEPSTRCRGLVLATVQRCCVAEGGKALLACPPSAQRGLLEALRGSLPPSVPVFVLPSEGPGRGPPGAGPQPLRSRLFSSWVGNEGNAEEWAPVSPGTAGGGGGSAKSGAPHWVSVPGVAEWDPRLAERPGPCVLFVEEAGLLAPPATSLPSPQSIPSTQGLGPAGLGPIHAVYHLWSLSKRNLVVGSPAALDLLSSCAPTNLSGGGGGRKGGIQSLSLDCDGDAEGVGASDAAGLFSWNRSRGAALRLMRQVAPRRVALVGADSALRAPFLGELLREVEEGLGMPCDLVPRRGASPSKVMIPVPTALSSVEVPNALLRRALESSCGASPVPSRTADLGLVFVRDGEGSDVQVFDEAAVPLDALGILPHEVLFECEVKVPAKQAKGGVEGGDRHAKRPRGADAASALQLAAGEGLAPGSAVAAPTFSARVVLEQEGEEGSKRLRCTWALRDHEFAEDYLRELLRVARGAEA